jgi:hypothetical protein
MSDFSQDHDVYTPPQAVVADAPDADPFALSTREKAVAWASMASYAIGAAISSWLLFVSSFSVAAIVVFGLSALGLGSAALWLRRHTWPLYVLPLLYLPQVVRVVSPEFNFYLNAGLHFYAGLNFGFGHIGVNLFALFMLIWSGLTAAGRLDKLDSAPSPHGA